MARQPKTSGQLILGIIARFLFSALFGGFISLVLLYVILHFSLDILEEYATVWSNALWLVPTCWGILGIFWYDRMLDIARDIVEELCRRD